MDFARANLPNQSKCDRTIILQSTSAIVSQISSKMSAMHVVLLLDTRDLRHTSTTHWTRPRRATAGCPPQTRSDHRRNCWDKRKVHSMEEKMDRAAEELLRDRDFLRIEVTVLWSGGEEVKASSQKQ